MPKTVVKIDLKESPYKNELIHNRWHPDIPIIEWVKPGEDFVMETYDWTGGFIKNNDSADDVRDIDLSIVHFLSGPIGVHGAEPGDLLVVDILDIGILPESPWGFNGFFSKKNGGGFLTDHFPLAQKSIWDISGLYTHSRHVPGVSFAGLVHPGLIGCLPDHLSLDLRILLRQNTSGTPDFAVLSFNRSASMKIRILLRFLRRGKRAQCGLELG